MKLEELEQRIDDLEKAQGRELSLARELLQLIKGNEQALKAKQDEEWPNVGDEYFIAVDNEEAYKIRCSNDAYDNYNLETGNCHRTEEGAEAYRKWLTDPRTQARRMVEMCEGFDAEGDRYIGIDRSTNRVFHTGWECRYGGLSFLTAKHAQTAIDKLGEDLIKVALGVIAGDEAREIVMRAMRRW